MSQLKNAIYARMEEVSFRSGAAAAGGVLTAAGVAITLAVVLGGPGDAVASAPASRAPAPPAAASSASPQAAPVSSSPPPVASWPQAAAPRSGRTTVPVTVAGDYRPPPSPARAPAARHAAATPVPGSTPTRPFDRRWTPRRWDLWRQPGWWGWHRPPVPWPWGSSPRHRRR